MEQKRSIGLRVVLRIVGLSLALFYGYLCFFSLIVSDFSEFLRYVSAVYPLPMKIVTLITYLALLSFVMGGILILLLKEFGRKLILYVVTINILNLIIGYLLWNLFDFESPGIAFNIIYNFIVGLFLIVFLTRPNVKEQFK